MKIIVSTSDKYHHVWPVFNYLFKKYWPEGFTVEVVGYEQPPLADGFTFYRMNEDRGPKHWSTDLRKYFEEQDDWFIWMMEDTFIKEVVSRDKLNFCIGLCYNGIGRVDLTKDVQKREHTVNNDIAWAHPKSRYRLSTQPSIWNKQYLLNYLHEGMTPWEFETQDPMDDGWQVVGAIDYPVVHNEGVRRHDINKFNMDGIDDPEVLKLCSNYI